MKIVIRFCEQDLVEDYLRLSKSPKLNPCLAPSMIDRVAEEELTILYIMNAAKGIQSNYLEHAKRK